MAHCWILARMIEKRSGFERGIVLVRLNWLGLWPKCHSDAFAKRHVASGGGGISGERMPFLDISDLYSS